MAGKKISALSAATDLATNDLVEMVDVSDTSMGPTGTNKKATLSQLIGPLLTATPGSMVANTAMVADSNGKMEGVSAAQLARLNVNAGAWAPNKALTTDASGRLLDVSSSQFVALTFVAGTWAAGKVLVPDTGGLLAGVSQTQFTTLAVTPGSFTNSKAVVLNGSGVVGNAKMTIDTQTPGVSLTTGTNSVSLSASSVSVGSSSGSGALAALSLTFTASTYNTVYGQTKLEIHTANGNIIADASSSPAFIRIYLGDAQCYLTSNSLKFQGATGGSLDIRLEGLPTSMPAERNRLWVDTAAGNVLKIRL